METMKSLRILSLTVVAGLTLLGLACVPPGSPPPPAGPQYQVSAWAPWTHTTAVKTTLERELATFDVVHPFWYSLKADDTIGAVSYVDPALVTKMQTAGVKVVPTMTDGFVNGRAKAVLADPNRRAAVLQRILDLVDAKGYDGIDLDWENMDKSARDLFSDFVDDLSTALHVKGKIVSLAVYPKTSEPGSWAGPQSHDYARLGAAADRINIMGYGYGYGGGPPNPIGPIHWLTRVLAFATTVVPAKKIQLGIPFYGRDWPEGASAKALTNVDVVNLVGQYNPTVTYDPQAGESTFKYTDSAGKKHTVWFQSPEGTGDKMELVKSHAIGGTVIWRLGSEDPKIFDAIRAKLKPTNP